jgi:hypothetical protein
MTFNTSTLDAAGALRIGAHTNGNAPVTNGTRIYAVAMGNAFLDDQQAAAILAVYEARHGRDYTP